MKIRYILTLALVCSMLSSVSVMAEETDDTISYDAENRSLEYLESIELDKQEPVYMTPEQVNELFTDEGMQPYATAPDDYEPNDSYLTAYPYNQVETIRTQLTGKSQLYTLGMKHAGFDSETDEDWYIINLTKGNEYFVDIRNTSKLNWFIELYYISGETPYYYSTDPDKYPVYSNAPEKYFYFVAEDTGTYYIRVSTGGDSSGDMHYFFYVGPSIQTFDIVDMPTYGGVNLLGGTDYRTYTLDLRREVPDKTSIVSISIKDNFPDGNACTEVDKYMGAGGKKYYNTSGTGSSIINGISGASLGQLWTLGGKCGANSHHTFWSARLNGRFMCVMEPYPGNELSF